MAGIDFVYYLILLASMLVLFRLLIKAFALSPTPRASTMRRNNIVLEDRQGNIFTIANESANNPLPHRFSDFFYVEPSAEDAARIRAQLEKDEKDLPTYEEVMAMSAAQTAAGTLSPPPTTSTTSVATTDTTVPPYSEVDRNGTRAAPLNLEMGATARPTGNVTAPAAEAGAASTSRAAAAAATSTATTATVVTIANSVSNTSV
ncbi:uncharacterized protein LOC126756070 isoform X8 [Bactrocera neohumeralis]|uniref:uncharacterized protein LOC126756070 isoform X8 n=1 Tax=Bactrocera neohumeralis TaxID=98809 RepID=UPI002165D92B|nr:uncharacterized protein LOC126756070 isoform X8 [Bactrocera neohumeralis]